MLQAAQRLRNKHKEPRGFVHIAEWEPPQSMDVLRVPLIFGTIAGETVTYRDHDCLGIGDMVADCLDREGIRYEWDREPGRPILIIDDESLTGMPEGDSHQAIHISEDHQVFRTPGYPECAFDKLAGNPVRLLNISKLRQLNGNVPHLRGSVKVPRVGDRVKLGFRIADAVSPKAREECGEAVDRIQTESMWVEVTRLLGRDPQCVFRGELLNAPVFIDPAKLRIGSPVNFTVEQIYPIETRSPLRTQR
jgi:hypothetical protein